MVGRWETGASFIFIGRVDIPCKLLPRRFSATEKHVFRNQPMSATCRASSAASYSSIAARVVITAAGSVATIAAPNTTLPGAFSLNSFKVTEWKVVAGGDPGYLVATPMARISGGGWCAACRCLYRKLNSTIMVVKAPDDRLRCDAAYVLDGTMDWRVFAKRPMSSQLVVVGSILRQDPAQVRFAQDNHMVNALATNRSDQPFGEAVLPWRAWGNRLVADSHGP